MHPWLIEGWGGEEGWLGGGVTSYGVCIVVGVVLAWVWARGRAKRVEVDPSYVDLMMPVIVGAGLIGAWIFGWWTDAVTDEEVHGAVLVGSLLFSTAAGIGYAVMCGIRLGVLGDICAGPLGLGIACGRVGCFLAGCCFGKVSSFSNALLAVRFPRGSFAFLAQVESGKLAADAAGALPVFPVQLYEAAGCLVLAGLVAWWPRQNGRGVTGEKFLLLGMGYAVLRLFLEMLRGDNPRVVRIGDEMGLTFSQVGAIFILVLSVGTWAVRRHWAGRLGLRSNEVATVPNAIPATAAGANVPASSR